LTDRIVVGSTGGWKAPHAKDRLGPLARHGPWPLEMVAVPAFPDSDDVDALVAGGGPGAVLVLQRVLPSEQGMRRLGEAYDHIVFDIDDAIYATPPELHGSALRTRAKQVARLAVRGSLTASSRRRPLERALRYVDVCVAGNSILAAFAGRFVPRVVEIPTTINPAAAPPAEWPSPPVLVWMGVSANLQYLELVRGAIERLTSVTDFTLRIVSQRTWSDSPVPCEFVKWSPEAERVALSSSTIGLAPLTDEPWTRGKCAKRAIAYGGHGLPAVASPVGITDQVVLHGRTGFLARSEDEWFDALHKCISDPELAARIGAQALEHVRESYSDDVACRLWRQLLADMDAGTVGSAQATG
jgi:glycosyltransferase involved in cell wall biosynthesis